MSLSLLVSSVARASANDIVLMSYSGHNKTIGPYWVAVDKGLYQKHGIDARLLQVRNAQISLSALVSGEVPVFLPSAWEPRAWRSALPIPSRRGHEACANFSTRKNFVPDCSR